MTPEEPPGRGRCGVFSLYHSWDFNGHSRNNPLSGYLLKAGVVGFWVKPADNDVELVDYRAGGDEQELSAHPGLCSRVRIGNIFRA